MTLFEKIAQGQIPCFKVWEDENHLAFLDIRPVAPGHTLVIPKRAIDPITKLSDEDFSNLWKAAKGVARLLETKLSCQRVCMAVVGFEVPHAHIHLIPARSMADFPWPGGKEASKAELSEIQKTLSS